VIDAPGGGGKIPILPEYVESITDKEVVLRNYAGEVYRYPLPQEPVAAGCGSNGNGHANGNGRKNGTNGKKSRNGKAAQPVELPQFVKDMILTDA
jgi:hypothetical protein